MQELTMSDLSFVSSTDSSSNASVAREPGASSPSPSPKLSVVALRERKKDQTREALAAAAFDLFQTKGYEATTVAEIARAANVSRRTFFRYFPTKDALLFIDNSDHLERFRELLGAREPGDSSFDPISRACLALAEEYMHDRDQILARARIIESSPGLSKQERQQDLLWEQAITQALLADRQPSPLAERRARMLAGATFGAMRATMVEWHRLDGRGDLVRLTREGLELFELRSLDLDAPSKFGASPSN
jgi:AcrR family transcriptional regulator